MKPHYQASTELDDSIAYRVSGYSGVAFWLNGDHIEPDKDTEWSGYENPTGKVVVHMVGDDHLFVVDLEDLTPLDETEYCPGCGQIGCACYR